MFLICVKSLLFSRQRPPGSPCEQHLRQFSPLSSYLNLPLLLCCHFIAFLPMHTSVHIKQKQKMVQTPSRDPVTQAKAKIFNCKTFMSEQRENSRTKFFPCAVHTKCPLILLLEVLKKHKRLWHNNYLLLPPAGQQHMKKGWKMIVKIYGHRIGKE